MPRVIPEYKDEARKKILEVATSLVLQKGYKQVNMADIAKEAGISRPTPYLYFKDKEELFLTVLKGLLEEVGDDAEESLRNPSVDLAGEFYDQVIERYGKRFEIFFEVITSGDIPTQFITEVGRLHELILNRMARQIEIGIPSYPNRPDPYILANIFFALFIGIKVRRKMGLSMENARDAWKTAFTGLLSQIPPSEEKDCSN